MIQIKHADELQFYVYEKDTGNKEPVTIDAMPRQLIGMIAFPEMIGQYAHGMNEYFSKQGITDIEIRATVNVTMNNRPVQPLVDPEYDLTQDRKSLISPPEFIMPEHQ